MTICIATNVSNQTTGGVPIFNNHFINLFTSFNHKVILLSVAQETIKDEEDIIINESTLLIKVILRKSYFDELKKYKPYFRPGGCNAPNYIAMGTSMREWLMHNHKSYNIDIIEASDHGGIGIFFVDNSLPPVIITAHASNLQISKYNFSCNDEHGTVIKKLEELSYKLSAAIICHSTIIKPELHHLTQQPVFTTLIPWEQKTSNAQFTIRPYALVVGELQTLKGPYILFNALQKVLLIEKTIYVKWIGDDTNTTTFGSSVGDDLKKKYLSIYNNNFELIKPVENTEVLKNMQEAAYIIIPSQWETFSYVALEAASLGKAIIITKETGASYLFTNNENAIVIESNDIEALANAILQLHTNSSLCERLGRNARKLVLQLFKPETIVTQRIDVYNKIINSHSVSKTTFETNMSFLKRYFTPKRKLYFGLRAYFKRFYLKLK